MLLFRIIVWNCLLLTADSLSKRKLVILWLMSLRNCLNTLIKLLVVFLFVVEYVIV